MGAKDNSKNRKKKPKVRSSAKAIIIRDGKLLLQVCNFGTGKNCYLFPGGGQKYEEKLTDTVQREVLEEIGADVKVGELLWVREYIQKNHEFHMELGDVHQIEHYFRCELLNEPDASRATHPDSVQVGIEWVALKKIRSAILYPQIIRERFDENGWIPGDIYAGDVN